MNYKTISRNFLIKAAKLHNTTQTKENSSLSIKASPLSNKIRRAMFSPADKEFVTDLVIALEAAQAMADRFGEEACVLKDFRVAILRLNEEPPIEIVKPRIYKRSALD